MLAVKLGILPLRMHSMIRGAGDAGRPYSFWHFVLSLCFGSGRWDLLVETALRRRLHSILAPVK